MICFGFIFTERLLKHLGIIDLFDELVCESDVNNKKPHPEMIDLILNKLKDIYLLKYIGHPI